ncbi:hypothetical protein L218DRAFT_946489 [Marasmius fiardii PR-910]|nr:hypothetical protein L218DRAFT_946489 [Marasmius fiardii PR-910]
MAEIILTVNSTLNNQQTNIEWFPCEPVSVALFDGTMIARPQAAPGRSTVSAGIFTGTVEPVAAGVIGLSAYSIRGDPSQYLILLFSCPYLGINTTKVAFVSGTTVINKELVEEIRQSAQYSDKADAILNIGGQIVNVHDLQAWFEGKILYLNGVGNVTETLGNMTKDKSSNNDVGDFGGKRR